MAGRDTYAVRDARDGESQAGLYHRRATKIAALAEARAALWIRAGYSIGMGLLLGMHAGGYVAWAENAKTPEAGAVSVLVTVGVSLGLLWATRQPPTCSRS